MTTLLWLVGHALGAARAGADLFQSLGLGLGGLLTGGAAAATAIIAWRTFSTAAVETRRKQEAVADKVRADEEAERQEKLEVIRNDEEKRRLQGQLMEQRKRSDVEESGLLKKLAIEKERHDNAVYEGWKTQGLLDQYRNQAAHYRDQVARLNPDGLDDYTGRPYAPSGPPA